jgi:hypothetical protein
VRRQAHGGRGDQVFELRALLGEKALGIGLLGEDAHRVGAGQLGIELGQRHSAVLENAWSGDRHAEGLLVCGQW